MTDPVEKADADAFAEERKADATEFGNLLKRLAEEKDVSAAALARAAGISASTVSQIMRGEIGIPPKRRIEGFAKALGVSVARLMGALPEEAEEKADMEAMIDERADTRASEMLSLRADAVTLGVKIPESAKTASAIRTALATGLGCPAGTAARADTARTWIGSRKALAMREGARADAVTLPC